MKKWIIIICLVGVIAILAATCRRWLPIVLAFAGGTNSTAIQTLSGIGEVVLAIVAIIIAIIPWFQTHRKSSLKEADLPSPTLDSQKSVSENNNIIGNQEVTGDGNIIAARIEIHGNVIQQRIIPKDSIVTALHQLPPPPADFTGRKQELNELLAHIQKGGVIITSLRGMGGIGKTTLALKLAESLASQYPDAQLYLDLRGLGQKPMASDEAQSYVIRAFHPDVKLPESEAEISAIYRSVLYNKRVLLLMDNAKDAQQLESLIPPISCALIITSRKRFTLPGLYAQDLDILNSADAVKLLLRIAPKIGELAEEIAKACGYLPLVLRLAGSTLSDKVALTPKEYLTQLNKASEKLTLIKASLSLSYEMLSVQTKVLWRKLAVFSGTFDRRAATEIWNIEPSIAQNVLDELNSLSMVEWDPKNRRYRLHDLVREYALSKLTPDEKNDIERRHSEYYVKIIGQADRLYKKGNNGIIKALKLYDQESVNIQKGQAWAAKSFRRDEGAALLCMFYADVGVYVLNLRQHPRERIRWRENALEAARKARLYTVEAALLGNLGMAYGEIGAHSRAKEYSEKHLALARKLGDRLSEGYAVGNLGVIYSDLGDYTRAIEFHLKHLEIARELGDIKGEERTLNNLGTAHYGLKDYRRAIEYQMQSIKLARKLKDLIGEAKSLGNLGASYQALGEYQLAIECQNQHLEISRVFNDRISQSRALLNLGNIYLAMGDFNQAIDYHQESLCICKEVEFRDGEGLALWNMSLAQKALGDRNKAITNAEVALKILKQIASPHTVIVSDTLAEWYKEG